MADPIAICPNCRAVWPAGAQVCPNCGYIASPGPAAWPPPPSNLVSPSPFSQPQGPKLVTGKIWGDIILGMGLSFASNFLACIGLVVMPILYFTLKANYPIFARGIGYGFIAGLALLLGAVVWCFAGLSNIHF